MKKFKVDNSLPKNIPLLFKIKVLDNSKINFQASKDKEGKFVFYTYEKVYEIVIKLALALKKIGISRGNNVAIISDNRKEWMWTDLAILSLGATDVPRGCDSMGNEIRFIINYSDCKIAFFENPQQFRKVLANVHEVPNLKKAIIFEDVGDEEWNDICEDSHGIEVIRFNSLLKDGEVKYSENPLQARFEIENGMEEIKEDDVATIIFTSGTTGVPKGVMLTHKNYMTMLSAVPVFIPCKKGNWWLSVLPVWHSFERLIQYVVPLMNCGIAYSKPVASVMLNDMAVIKPQWMCGVPRLWEALAKGVNKAMQKKGGISLFLFKFFVSVGKHYKNNKDRVMGHVCRLKKRIKFIDFCDGFFPMILLWPLNKLGNALVFKKIRAKFGGNIKIAISGGGALQKDVDDFYRAIGLNLLEGYGLSETAPVISFRYYKQPRPGCVGAIFPTVQVKILQEEHGVVVNQEPLPPGKKGLIFVKSDQVMKGYYKRPDLTEKVIDKDGWFNTGDLGIRTFDNELKITGRCKDTIVLSDGENIEPNIIESALCSSNYIESAIVLGQDKKYLGSLIVPNKEAVVQYAQDKGMDFTDYEALLQTQQIQALIFKEITDKDSEQNGFRPCERIFKFALLSKSFKVGEELSAKQEMMRYKITEKYASLIATLF